jgi:hypothetical protein
MKEPWLGLPGVVPLGFETGRLRVRPLTIHDAVKDYDAVMSSRDHLRGVFGPQSDWPPDALTIEDDLIDLAWHQKEFRMRSSFAYTVVAPDESRVLGCVYLYPPSRAGCDADVFYWVRSSELASGLEEHLWEHLRRWLAEQWPFGAVALPWRDPDRDDLRTRIP